jgi:hypothetical protein
MTTNGQSGAFFGGAGLVWRRQRVLWWTFIVNLVLAHFASRDLVDRVRPVFNTSLASATQFFHGFHFAAIGEIGTLPGNYLEGGSAPMHFSMVFFLYMVLATGGILDSYWRDATVTTSEFFMNGGRYFWRFLRMVFFLLLTLIPVGIIAWLLSSEASRIDADSISPFPYVWFELATVLIVVLLLMAIRTWYDLAEIIAVADGETASRRCLRRAASVLRQRFASLFWLHFRISVLALLGFLAGIHVWVRWLHPESLRTAFVVSQLIILFLLATRFWQRASATIWYKRYLESATPAALYPPAPQTGGAAHAEELVGAGR